MDPENKIFGNDSAVLKKCLVLGIFVNRCVSDKTILGRILIFIQEQDIWKLEICANNCDNLIVRFLTVDTHEPDIIFYLLMLFPEIDMRFSTFNADGEREDLVRLVEDYVECIRYPLYLNFNVDDMVSMEVYHE